jgi:hypothetical protein
LDGGVGRWSEFGLKKYRKIDGLVLTSLECLWIWGEGGSDLSHFCVIYVVIFIAIVFPLIFLDFFIYIFSVSGSPLMPTSDVFYKG